MSLTQFGSVLSFAIDLEEQLSNFYTNAIIKFAEQYSLIFNERISASNKRKSKLEKSRRENVTEMTLEPINGLHSEDYKLDVNLFTLENINSLEEIITKFYAEAGPKLNVLESQRLFRRCFKEHKSYDVLS